MGLLSSPNFPYFTPACRPLVGIIGNSGELFPDTVPIYQFTIHTLSLSQTHPYLEAHTHPPLCECELFTGRKRAGQ